MSTKDYLALFDTKQGKDIYERILSCIDDNGMHAYLGKGVLLGFSGGADSVMCALLLLKIKKEIFDFPLVLCHVNHGIRGQGAERDMHFSVAFAAEHDLKIIVRQVDAPSFSQKERVGIEEGARTLRYRAFEDILRSRSDIATLVTAHNATDNLETLLQRLLRGSGARGMCAIPPVRDYVIRPMLYVPKKDIVSFLEENEIAFVTDETNADVRYTRNFIRCEILPLLETLSSSPEESITRFTQNLREDEECLDLLARNFLDKYENNIIDVLSFRQLHAAIQARVLCAMVAACEREVMLERHHILSVLSALERDKARVSLPGELSLVIEHGKLYVLGNTSTAVNKTPLPPNTPVYIPELDMTAILCDEEGAKTFLNVYKNSIQVSIPSAIIKGELCVRTRNAADAYRYAGMTHRLKTLFQSLHLPKIYKDKIPVFCDDDGIVYVPPFGIRDGEKHNTDAMCKYTLLMCYPPDRLPPWMAK